MTIEKIFEDEYVLVINKPCGLVVNRSETNSTKTLQDFLDEDYPIYTASVETEFGLRSGIVHRLDKDTSGILLVAKTEDSFKALQAQFKDREVDKQYVAVLMGAFEHETLEIDAPIKRNPVDPFKYSINPEGKPSQTKIVKKCEFTRGENTFTLVDVFPKTGRTHQIRVHAAAISHPVAGDDVYSTRKEYEVCSQHFNRLMLHAFTISFIHPKTEEKITLNAPIPSEFSCN